MCGTRRGDSGVFIEFMLARLLEAIAAAGAAGTAPTLTLTLAEVAAHVGKSTSAIERAARKLREAGRLHYLGPRKGGRWEVAA